jgi:hypothetical protein
VGEDGVGGAQALPLAVGQVDRVGEDGAGADEVGVLVDAEVVGRGEAVAGQRALVEVLRQVRRDGQVEAAREGPGGGEQLRRAGQREAGDDGDAEPAGVVAVPAGGQRREGGDGDVDRMTQGLRAVAVHQHGARDGAEAAGVQGLKQDLGGLGVRGAVDQGQRGAGRGEVVAEGRGDGARVGGVGEARLLGEDGVGEPGQQLAAGASDDPGLRVVDVGVDEAGDQHARAEVVVDPLPAPRRDRDHRRPVPLDEGVGEPAHREVVTHVQRPDPQLHVASCAPLSRVRGWLPAGGVAAAHTRGSRC